MDKKIFRLFCFSLLDSISYGITFPFIPLYINTFKDSWNPGYVIAIYFFMQFITSTLWGSLADRFGRKRIILTSILGSSIALMLNAFSSNILQFIFTRAVSGVFSSASLPTVYAYVADYTNENERAQKFGVLGSAYGLGFIIGPLIGGIIFSYYFSGPLLVASVIAVVNEIFTLLFIPSKEIKIPVRKEIVNSKNIFFPIPNLSLGIYGFIFFISTFALSGLEVSFPLYAVNQFKFTEVEVGLFFSFIGLVIGITQGMLTGIIVNKFGEIRSILLAHICMMLGYLVLAITHSVFVIIIATAMLAFGIALNEPCLVSVISKTSKILYGNLIAKIWSFSYLARTIGPFVEGYVYNYFKELLFFLNFIIIIISTLIIIFYISSSKDRITYEMRIQS